MVFLDGARIVGGVGELSQRRGGLKEGADFLVQQGMVFLERQHLITLSLHDGLGNIFLTTHGLNGHNTTCHIQ